VNDPVAVSPNFKDALTELVNMGMGRAGDVLNDMLDSHIVLNTPEILIIKADALPHLLAAGDTTLFSSVEMNFNGLMDGRVRLLFQAADAGKLVDRILGEAAVQEEGLDALRAGTLSEVGNIVINAILGTISNALGMELHYTVPFYRETTFLNLSREEEGQHDQIILLIKTRFLIQDLEVSGNIAVILSLHSFDQLRSSVNEYIGVLG